MKKRSAKLVEKAYHELKEKAKAENEVVKQIYKQFTRLASRLDHLTRSRLN